MPTKDSPADRQPAPTDADWRRLVAKSLGEAPIATLNAQIEPRISIDPLQPAEAAQPLWSRGGKGWTRLQRLGFGADATTIETALAAGADGFEIVIAGSAADTGDGLAADRLGACLAAIAIDRCRLRLAPGAASEAIADAVEAAVGAGRLDPQLLSLSFGFDPVGAIASGRIAADRWGEQANTLATLVGRLAARGYDGPFATADGRLVHAAGGTASMELGYALASLLALIRALLDAGVDPALAAAAVDVALAADADQFVTIAKFRAMRLLQAKLLQAASLPPSRLVLHGETSWRMLADEDRRSNVIRTTIAAVAAGIGGADTLTVLPFTAASGATDPDAERLAMTTQAILIEETHVARVADPGAGSGTIGALTLALAEEAWRRFQAIERAGGIAASLGSGQFQAEITEAAARAEAEIAEGRRGIVGVTLFRADGAPPRAPRPRVDDGHERPAPLRPRRLAAPFEEPQP